MRGLLFFGRRILIAAILERTVFLEPTEWRITVDEGRKPIQDSQAAKQNVVQKPFSSAGVARKGLLFLRERWPRATVLPFPQFHIAVDLLLKSRRQNFFALGGRQAASLLNHAGICRSGSWTAVLTDGCVGKKTRATTRQHGSCLTSRPEPRFQPASFCLTAPSSVKSCLFPPAYPFAKIRIRNLTQCTRQQIFPHRC